MPTGAESLLPEPLLQVRDLRTWFLTDSGPVRAVDGVSFDLHAGETLGVVGESGSGKSVCAKSIMRLLDEPARIVGGSILFKGRDLAHLDDEGIRAVRGREIAMVFQDPMTSLNPVMRVGNQITESLKYHLDVSKDYADETALALLKSVGIPEAERRMRNRRCDTESSRSTPGVERFASGTVRCRSRAGNSSCSSSWRSSRSRWPPGSPSCATGSTTSTSSSTARSSTQRSR